MTRESNTWSLKIRPGYSWISGISNVCPDERECIFGPSWEMSGHIRILLQIFNIQYFSVANISSFQVEFDPIQWTQKPWNLTHPVCVQNRLKKESFLSQKSEGICYECEKKHSYPQLIILHPNLWIPACRKSSLSGPGFTFLLHHFVGVCREWNFGFGSHYQHIFAAIQTWYNLLHYQIL